MVQCASLAWWCARWESRARCVACFSAGSLILYALRGRKRYRGASRWERRKGYLSRRPTCHAAARGGAPPRGPHPSAHGGASMDGWMDGWVGACRSLGHGRGSRVGPAGGPRGGWVGGAHGHGVGFVMLPPWEWDLHRISY